MGQQVTVGGQRIGSGNKMKTYMHGYERSTHNLTKVWKSTMAAGTLVPFYSELGLPGDTFDINIEADALTHPTIGPLFGSYKMQIDLFQTPIRLYNGKLMMNRVNVGMNMQSVALPQLKLTAWGRLDQTKPLDNQQINPSCIFSYLGIRGLGADLEGLEQEVIRNFNAVPYLSYWDIYKQYYANKQEGIGAVIHKDVTIVAPDIDLASWVEGDDDGTTHSIPFTGSPAVPFNAIVQEGTIVQISGTFPPGTVPAQILFSISNGSVTRTMSIGQMFTNVVISDENTFMYASGPVYDLPPGDLFRDHEWTINIMSSQAGDSIPTNVEPSIVTFPLENIDTMREQIQSYIVPASPYEIDETAIAPYGLPMKSTAGDPMTNNTYSKLFSQEGLALKTYQSDLLNNWIDTDFIDGVNGISEVTQIDTSAGNFKIDELNMMKKLYVMLSRIALSSGDYQAWVNAVYDEEMNIQATAPMYIGGLSKELVFQEVVSNAATDTQPLGTLAGRGRIAHESTKGGDIIAKIKEPSYIMGIVSLTPRLDYSQGNKWDMSLQTMNDLHKPALDEIGYKNLVTDLMAWWDTKVDGGSGLITYKSAGKQPAWIKYMTAINEVRGNFADQTQQMFMVLNRRYGMGWDQTTMSPLIADVTTYIDPVKFNHIFAYTQRDAQNFWVQIRIRVTARRKMSAKIIPNL